MQIYIIYIINIIMNKDKIVEIAKFRGTTELVCTKCGVISPVELLDYEFNGPRVRANCPDCGAYIKFMPTAKTWRIFYNAKFGLVEIEKIPTDRLTWHLKNVKTNDDIRNAIEQLIERRTSDPETFRAPIGDIETAEISKAIERRNFLQSEIKKAKAENVARVRDLDPAAAWSQVDQVQKFCNAKALIISDYEKELARVLKNINKLENEN